MADDHRTDVLVIGAGPGGYVAAIRAGQLGLDATLVDREAYGGTCLNHGCIPSKALITATDVAHEADHAEEFGIAADVSVDFGAMVDWKDDVVGQLTRGVEKLSKANGVELIEGTARFSDRSTAEVRRDGDVSEIGFEHAVVATGSRPIELPGFAFDDGPVLNSRQALALDAVPESLVVVGAGYIGMELAGVFAKLGADVTVVEMLDSILPTYGEDLTRPVRKRAGELGIDFHFGEAASEWRAADGGIEVVTETGDGAERVRPAEKVLVAVGRTPVTDTLDLGRIGLDPDEDGFLETDDRARTAVENVFAVGDVAGEPMLAHAAGAEGRVAAEVIAGEDSALDHRAVPAVVFTDPEIATVGLSEAEARERGLSPAVGEFPLRASGRSLTMGNAEGFVRVVADGDTGRVVGARLVGPEASELLGELTLAVETGRTLADLAGTIHTHPTLSEAVMEAAENALGRAIHTLNR